MGIFHFMNKIGRGRIVQNTDSVVQDDRELKKEQPAMPEDTRQRQDGGDPVHREPGEGAEHPRYNRAPQAEPGREQKEGTEQKTIPGKGKGDRDHQKGHAPPQKGIGMAAMASAGQRAARRSPPKGVDTKPQKPHEPEGREQGIRSQEIEDRQGFPHEPQGEQGQK
jgi:hypothetical protein